MQVKLGPVSPSRISAGLPGHASLMLEPAFLMMRLTAGHSAKRVVVLTRRKGPEWHEEMVSPGKDWITQWT